MKKNLIVALITALSLLGSGYTALVVRAHVLEHQALVTYVYGPSGVKIDGKEVSRKQLIDAVLQAVVEQGQRSGAAKEK